MKRIFVINPGCTSTKVAVYEDDKAVWTDDGLHPQEEIDKFMTVDEQYEYRMISCWSCCARPEYH